MTSRIILEYDPEFPFSIPDGKIEEEVSDIISFQQCGNNFLRIYGVENIFSAIRLAIAEGRLNHNGVFFTFRGKNYSLNEYGKMETWPDGFCDFNINNSEKILRAVMKKYKERNEK